MKKFKLLPVFVFTCSLLLAGCGKTSNSSSNPNSSSSAPNSSSVAPSTSSKTPDSSKKSSTSDAPVPAITKFEMRESRFEMEIGGTLNLATNLVIEGVNGATPEVVWSVDNERIASISAAGVLTAKDSGRVLVTATSVFDARIKAMVEVDVIFAKDFKDAGFTFSGDFPLAEVMEFTGSNQFNIFVPDSKYTELGVWYQSVPEDEDTVAQFSIIFNISNGTERDSEYGNQLIEDMGNYKNHYAYLDLESSETRYMSKDGKYVLLWRGVYTADYSNMYLAFTYVSTNDLFYDDTKTYARNWSADEYATMEYAFGEAIPFIQLGINYQFMYSEADNGLVICDFSRDHKIIDNYLATLAVYGYKYSAMEGQFYKDLGNNQAIFIQAMFTSYGNTLVVTLGNMIYKTFPENLANTYTDYFLESENKMIPFVVTSNECVEYRAYFQADDYDEFPYSEDSFEVRGLFYDYNDLAAYAQKYIDAGFELTYSDYYEWNTQEHMTYYTFVKGALEISISLEPEYEFNWDTFEATYYWDRCTLCVNAHHSENFEKTGVYFFNTSLEMYTNDYAMYLDYAVVNLEGADIEFISDNTDVCTIDSDGCLTPVGAGEATIYILANGGEYYDVMVVTVIEKTGMSFEEIIAYTRESYQAKDGFTILVDECYYGGDDYSYGAWTMIIADTNNPYGDYGESGLEYEMWDLAFNVPYEMFGDEIYSNYYMGDHYMYTLTGCMCDVSVDGIELDIMIYADLDGNEATMIRIDFWNWN